MPVDHYENFPVASLLLPRELRQPIEAIYRFARSADDIADEGEATPAERLSALAAYASELDRIEHDQPPGDPALAPVFGPLRTAIVAHRLPVGLCRDLLDAFAQDVTTTRYARFADLLDYCRRSANPVGRLLLHLVKRATPENLERSDAICSALQLVNFWQDVAIDWRKQRVYLPQEDLVRFGVDEAQIAAGRCDDAWRALLAFQIERARTLMLAGAPLVHELPGRMGWEIRLTVQGGLRILDRLETAGGDVFRRRPRLGAADWLRMSLAAAIM